MRESPPRNRVEAAVSSWLVHTPGLQGLQSSNCSSASMCKLLQCPFLKEPCKPLHTAVRLGLNVQAILNSHYSYQQGVLSCQLRAAITCLVFKKALLVSTVDMTLFSSGQSPPYQYNTELATGDKQPAPAVFP